MVKKVDATKQISEIFSLEWQDNFSTSGSTIITTWFENIADRLNQLAILAEHIDFDEYIEGKNKIPKAKTIANVAGFKFEEEWFTTSKPNSKSSGSRASIKIADFESKKYFENSKLTTIGPEISSGII